MFALVFTIAYYQFETIDANKMVSRLFAVSVGLLLLCCGLHFDTVNGFGLENYDSEYKTTKKWPHDETICKTENLTIAGDVPTEKVKKDRRDFSYTISETNVEMKLCERQRRTNGNSAKFEGSLYYLLSEGYMWTKGSNNWFDDRSLFVFLLFILYGCWVSKNKSSRLLVLKNAYLLVFICASVECCIPRKVPVRKIAPPWYPV